MKPRAIVALSLMLTTGCVILPPLSRKPLAGKVRITNSDAESIVIGSTDRAVVTNRFGAASMECKSPPALAYSWELDGPRVISLVGEAIPGPGRPWGPMEGRGERELGFFWRALFVAFDERGMVSKKQFMRLAHDKSLDDQLEAWAKLPIRK